MLTMNLVVISIGNAIIAVASAHSSEPALWCGVAILGFGFSSSWPGLFAFVEERIRVTDLIAGVFFGATSVHAAIVPLFEGPVIETNPNIFTYINFASGILCLLGFAALCYTDTIRKKFIVKRNSVESP